MIRLFTVLVPLWVTSVQGNHFLSSEEIPVTSFSCVGRPTGYYADTETGCQVYHMCEADGRQFSYSCPNTTLFHQRMLICAHWYQVNCSRSESHYNANLLIGQKDKPFVSDEEHKYFNYRKRLPIYGVHRTTVAAVRQFHDNGSPQQGTTSLVPTSATNIEFNSTQNDTLLPATIVNDRSDSEHPTTADYSNVNGTTDIQGDNTFINRFTYQDRVQDNPFTARSEYKDVLRKYFYTYDSGIPSLYLQPPLYNNEGENNKIELVFEDPRRVFYIGENGTESVNVEPVLVTIRLNKSKLLFRNDHSCDRCHPLFITHKDTCMPCVVVVR